MQNILSIDITTSPAQALVLGVDGASISIMETRTADLGTLFSYEQLLANTAEPLEGRTDGINPETETGEELESPQATQLSVEPFRNLLESIETPWTSSVLIAAFHNFLSLQLQLPFSDSKNINRVIDLEVQDLVPFDVSEFAVQHSVLGKSANGLNNIYVSLMPKEYVNHLLSICKQCEYEPLVLTNPSSTLGVISRLDPELTDQNSAIVLLRDNYLHFCARIDGEIAADRVINRSLQADLHTFTNQGDSLLQELRLTLLALENRFERPINNIYLMGNTLGADQIEQCLGCKTEKLDLSSLIKCRDQEESLAAIAAVFAKDDHAPRPLTNFRIREFSYNPQLRELFRGAASLVPYLVGALIIIVIALTANFVIKEYRIKNIYGTIQEAISRKVPALELVQGQELNLLQNRNQTLDDNLKRLGSLSQFSPLESLARISDDFPKKDDVTIRELIITPSTIDIKGYTKSYTALSSIKKALKRRKDIYCKVERKTTGTATKSFTFTINICE